MRKPRTALLLTMLAASSACTGTAPTVHTQQAQPNPCPAFDFTDARRAPSGQSPNAALEDLLSDSRTRGPLPKSGWSRTDITPNLTSFRAGRYEVYTNPSPVNDGWIVSGALGPDLC
jgi:hypothetical protein